jgi:hypothetical protein
MGDDAANYRVKRYWEIIADNLSKAGWSWGCVSAIDSNPRTIWIVDVHRDDGERFVVRADEKLNCVPGARFIEYEALNRAKLPNHQGGIRAAPNEDDLWYPPDCRSRIEL